MTYCCFSDLSSIKDRSSNLLTRLRQEDQQLEGELNKYNE